MSSQRSGLVLALAALVGSCGTAVGPQPPPHWGPARREAEARCQQGSPVACAELGRLLVSEQSSQTDLDRGVVLLEVACSQDDVAACTTLGNTYARRFDHEQAQARARELLGRACERQSAKACIGLGKISAGEGDNPRAAYYRKACELGDAEGCELEGYAEWQSDGPGDAERGEEALTRACRLGRLNSCLMLANERLQDPATRGEGVVLLLETCRRGHAHSCLIAALEFAPVISPRPDCARAVSLGQQACAGGQKEGCGLADACRMSGPGRAQALEALGRACEQKDGVACFYWADAQRAAEADLQQVRRAFRMGCMSPVGTLFQRQACGRLGAVVLSLASTAREKNNAILLLQESCESSTGQACCDLAQAYRSGIGVDVDAARAAELQTRACALGEQRCCAPPAPK